MASGQYDFPIPNGYSFDRFTSALQDTPSADFERTPSLANGDVIREQDRPRQRLRDSAKRRHRCWEERRSWADIGATGKSRVCRISLGLCSH